jgi:hypothetical protein
MERLKHSTKGLKGQIVKNSVGNQGLAVLCQSIGWVGRKVSWLPLVTFIKVQSTLLIQRICLPLSIIYFQPSIQIVPSL